jgi:hypothetical protein
VWPVLLLLLLRLSRAAASQLRGMASYAYVPPTPQMGGGGAMGYPAAAGGGAPAAFAPAPVFFQAPAPLVMDTSAGVHALGSLPGVVIKQTTQLINVATGAHARIPRKVPHPDACPERLGPCPLARLATRSCA